MDKIKIKDLEVYCNHGVFKEENVLGQKFLVSLTLFLDTKPAGSADAIDRSVSYADVAHFVNTFMKEHTFKLLEAVAEHLTEEILLHFAKIEAVTIEIKKPWAPILLPIDTVSVEIERSWHTAYLALGANMGEKEENLRQAIALLDADSKTRVTRESSFITTEPMGEVEQDDFLNGVVEIRTLRSPEELLNLVAEIEEKLKRVRTVHWGPRTIDIDIILYEQMVVHTKQLTIPHADMQNRDFVLAPLAEIAPQAMHPLLNKNVYQLKQELKVSYLKKES